MGYVECMDSTIILIFLHDVGQSADDLKELFMLNNICEDNCRIVLPNAPLNPVTYEKGKIMNSWFDINSYDTTRFQDPKHIRRRYNQ